MTAGTPPNDGDGASVLLAAHVPLTLLMDLADPDGPQSGDLLAAEPGDADWLAGA